MAQLGRELDLAQESLGAQRLPDLMLQHLDRDVAVVPEVAREVDRGHTAHAEFALDAVAIDEGSREVRQRGVHPEGKMRLKPLPRRGWSPTPATGRASRPGRFLQ